MVKNDTKNIGKEIIVNAANSPVNGQTGIIVGEIIGGEFDGGFVAKFKGVPTLVRKGDGTIVLKEEG